MTDTLSTRALVERVDAMEPAELDLLQAAIDRRRGELAGQEGAPVADPPVTGPPVTVIERRAYGSGVLQLEKRDEGAPCWYFYLLSGGRQKTVYIGETEEPETALAHIKGGMGG